ncbi:MAG: 4-phosphoerythronate dehydrogenase PdxB [Bacteroidota bacterium]
MKIVADKNIPFLKGALDQICQMVYLPGSEIKKEHVKDADALIVRTRTKCNQELLEGTSVKFIASATIGFDHIDTEFCRDNRIAWTNAPGCNASSVKQYIASALAEIIQRKKLKFRDITIGIIGVGNVGSRIEHMARVLGMNVLLYDPPRQRKEQLKEFASLAYLQEFSDIITLHVPLNLREDRTFHMVDDPFLSRMKKGAWIINSSRGEVIDTPALIKALHTDHLSGAVIDVWENEPRINRQLLEMALLTTPHIAGYSVDGKAKGTSMSVNAGSDFFHLGMDNWYPSRLPKPASDSMVIDCSETLEEEIFIQSSRFAYDIVRDSDELKNNPEKFEKLRSNYPVRREPENLRVKMNQKTDQCAGLLRALGFWID